MPFNLKPPLITNKYLEVESLTWEKPMPDIFRKKPPIVMWRFFMQFTFYVFSFWVSVADPR